MESQRWSRNILLMQTALIWARRGTCSRAHVGTVFSREGRILVQGYNGAPAGMEHCNHDCTCHYVEALGHAPNCGTRAPCTIAVHAEANGIAFAARVGVSLEGAEVHTTRVPCRNCAMLIINSGIKKVTWGEEHRDMTGLTLLQSSHVEVVRYDNMVA